MSLTESKPTFSSSNSYGYGEKLGGSVTDTAPCTKNGFLAGRNGEVIAEYKAPYGMPQDGAELYRVINGKEELVGIFKEGENFNKFVSPNEYSGIEK